MSPDADVPRHLQFPKGMLGGEERRALYWLAREIAQGDGHVIDAGAFLGTSAYSLAAGLNDSPRSTSKKARVHSYDLFVASKGYISDWLSKQFGGGAGQNFRDIFEYQTAAFASRIVTHEGDVLKQRWTGEPVEILFIDLAKSKTLNGHIVSQWFPSLIPGHSVVLQQDFFLARHPWIHVTMEYFKEYFEVVDELISNCTRLYRIISPIPAGEIERVASYSFSAAEERRYLDSYVSGERRGPLRDMAELVSVCHHMLQNDFDNAAEELQAFARKSPHDLHPGVKNNYDSLVQWLANRTGQSYDSVTLSGSAAPRPPGRASATAPSAGPAAGDASTGSAPPSRVEGRGDTFMPGSTARKTSLRAHGIRPRSRPTE